MFRYFVPLLFLLLFLPYRSSTANTQTEFERLQVCAEAGQMICQLELGKIYAAGHEVEQDLDKALYWLQKKPAEDNGYGPNVEALQIIELIERYKKSDSLADLYEIESYFDPLHILDYYSKSDTAQSSPSDPLPEPFGEQESDRPSRMGLFTPLAIAFRKLGFSVYWSVNLGTLTGLAGCAMLLVAGKATWERKGFVVKGASTLTRKRSVRIAISLYLAWLASLFFIFVLDRLWVVEANFLWDVGWALVFMPPAVGMAGLLMVNWCRKGI